MQAHAFRWEGDGGKTLPPEIAVIFVVIVGILTPSRIIADFSGPIWKLTLEKVPFELSLSKVAVKNSPNSAVLPFCQI
ncbi:hypothetical protein P9747_13120 [Paenibacillus macerans]|uniref:hypothetical protein n=1 Tax=Paenibacillus macerans TaxID=44252 RepID=UPI002E1B5A66|nr:hypothetical protein [Paenibacillus macerans]